MSDAGEPSGRVGSLASPRGAVARAAGVLLAGAGDVLSRNQAVFTMAAAMAYRTIFSLVPLLIIALLVLRLFRDDDESLVRSVIERALHQVGLGQIAVEGAADGGATGVRDWITGIVANFKGINFTGIGLVSAGLLVYAAMSLLMGLEEAFNRLYGVARGRRPLERMARAWLVLTVGPMLVAASFVVGDKFQALALSVSGVAGEHLSGVLVSAAGYAVTVLISASLLVVLYVAVPNAPVRWGPALIGAACAAVLLELAKLGFQVYARGAGLKSMYGAMALLPLFMLWVYVTWVLVLSGLRVAYLVQHRGQSHGAVAAGAGPTEPRLIEPTALLGVAFELARGFELGRPRDEAELARACGLGDDPPARMIAARMADALVADGVALRVEPATAPHPTPAPRRAPKAASPATPGPRWALARPAAKVRAADVLQTAQRVVTGDVRPGTAAPEPALDHVTAAARRAQVAALGDRTLTDLTVATAGPPAS